MKKIALFCLPFAGGNKYSYRVFAEKAPSFIHVNTLEYPGRGARIKEPLISDINILVDDVYNQIKDKVDTTEYAIYGHSLGGLVAYLLAKKLIENNHNKPVHLFITGTTGPASLSRGSKKRHTMPKEEFIEELKDFGGMPDEILQNDELLHYFEPILRSDFKASENYVYENYPPLNIPFTVITGMEEDMEFEDIRLWQKETEHVTDFRRLPGKHFFIFNYGSAIVDIISKKLSVYTKAYQL